MQRVADALVLDSLAAYLLVVLALATALAGAPNRARRVRSRTSNPRERGERDRGAPARAHRRAAHHLGGVAAALTGVNILTVPDTPGRFTVDEHPTDSDAPPAIVDIWLRSDGVSARISMPIFGVTTLIPTTEMQSRTGRPTNS
jgi:hypothetical protein